MADIGQRTDTVSAIPVTIALARMPPRLSATEIAGSS
jgi:hypothetical protein